MFQIFQNFLKIFRNSQNVLPHVPEFSRKFYIFLKCSRIFQDVGKGARIFLLRRFLIEKFPEYSHNTQISSEHLTNKIQMEWPNYFLMC